MKIALIGNASNTMLGFRGPLIRAMIEAGHEVITICPMDRRSDVEALSDLGARHVALGNLSRQGLNPSSELRLLADLTTILKSEQPDRVFAYFLKPVIWSAIAARRAGIPRCVGMIEGMGSAFSLPPSGIAPMLRQHIARSAIILLLRKSLPALDHVLVLNNDDAELLRDVTGIETDRITVMDGIGVDLEHFQAEEPHTLPFRFTLAARMIQEKGIELFVEAATRVKAVEPDICFRILGGTDNATNAIKTRQLETWVRKGIIEWPGEVFDIRPHLRETSVFVLPTLYREGLPRSIMEAMAMGRAVITSNMPGARSSLADGLSGLVLPVGDINRLTEACFSLYRNPERTAAMGRHAQYEASMRYNVNVQNELQIKVILG